MTGAKPPLLGGRSVSGHFTAQQRQQHFCRQVNFLLHRKLDGGQLGHHRAGDLQIIKTSDGYFFRHTNAAGLQCLHGIDCHSVIGCHQSVKGLTTLIHQQLHRIGAGRSEEGARATR